MPRSGTPPNATPPCPPLRSRWTLYERCNCSKWLATRRSRGSSRRAATPQVTRVDWWGSEGRPDWARGSWGGRRVGWSSGTTRGVPRRPPAPAALLPPMRLRHHQRARLRSFRSLPYNNRHPVARRRRQPAAPPLLPAPLLPAPALPHPHLQGPPARPLPPGELLKARRRPQSPRQSPVPGSCSTAIRGKSNGWGVGGPRKTNWPSRSRST
jgi:hypothetical protein